ncbi:MAG: M20/M25/M40 family metallo-hydrolase [Pyrinomonadaceae bacterium]|nr:M20/M25/M40 family metallo-hydrolase [Pyrinomonadaceae bacterium]
MFRRKHLAFAVITALLLPSFSFGNNAVAKIRDEGMNRSEAMKIMHYLTDVIGQRLTNSPSQRRANKWTKKKFEEWGLSNAKIDPWGEFGKSWELKSFSMSLTTPEYEPIRAYPKAWSPSTNGKISAPVVYLSVKSAADLEKYRGKLKGAIVLAAPEGSVSVGFDPVANRLSEKQLADLEKVEPQPQTRGARRQLTAAQSAARNLRAAVSRLVWSEKPAVILDPGRGVDAGTIRVMGARMPPREPGQPRVRVYSKNAEPTIPQFVVEVEQYNRLVRLAKRGIDMKMDVELDVAWDDSDTTGYNTIAEIPGTDPELKDEVVMIGAHLDSWHAGTGATDNGAGVTVTMEAMRILMAQDLKPKRTIRVALWTGEEQGLLGSRAYVANEFGNAKNKKPAYDNFAAYYNLDNGTGQIRGINAQGNKNARPIFREWLKPLADLDASTTSIRRVGGTDHLAFDAAGLPGFQFIQDRIEYFGRTWHTTQDVADRMIEKDLKRSAVIMATFAYNSAMSDEKLPRKGQGRVASILRTNYLADAMDDFAFKYSGLDFSICGHDVHPGDIPESFPSIFAVKDIDDLDHLGHDHAE